MRLLKPIFKSFVASVFTAAFTLSAPVAQAATTISPVVLEIGNIDRTSFTVKNTSNRAVPYQLSLLAWTQEKGEDRLKPSDELVISPPAFTLAPGASREVRIGYRQKQARSATERAFRVMVEELPDLKSGNNAAGLVTLTVKHLLPLYSLSSNPNAAPDLSWSIQQDGQRLRIRAENRGERRAFIRDMSLAAANSNPSAPLTAPRGRTVILAKSSIEWAVPINATGSHDQWSLTLTDQFGQSRQQTLRLNKP